jgi:hypothetical protein
MGRSLRFTKEIIAAACPEKYRTPGLVQYVKDMSRRKSRNTTTELVPLDTEPAGSCLQTLQFF